MLGDRHEATRCRLLAMEATWSAGSGDDYPVSHDLLKQAEAFAEKLENPELTAEVLQARETVHYFYMELPQVVDVGRRAAAFRQDRGELHHVCEATWLMGIAFVLRGRLGEALELTTELEALSARVGNVNAQYCARLVRACSRFLTAEGLATLAASAQADVEYADQTGNAWVSFSHVTRGLARFYSGDWAAARSDFETAVLLAPGQSWMDGRFPSTALLARAYAGEDVLRKLQRDKSHLIQMGAENLWGRWEQLVNVVESLAVLGEAKDAGDLYPHVVNGIQKGVVVTWQLRLWQMVAGIAAACGEQWDTAQEHFETALRQAHELPHKIAQPEVRRWYAQMLLDRNVPGDRDKARTLLGEAVEMYGAIVMPKHLEMANELLRAHNL